MTLSNINHKEKPINRPVTIIPTRYIDAILTLNRALQNKNFEWAISGDLGENLQTVHVDPNCVEIVTNKAGGQQIYQAVQEYKPQKIERRTEVLPRTALIEKKEFPVKIRSYFFEFNINYVKIKVFSDLQYQIGDWEWGDIIEFKPEYISVVGQKMAVMPLEIAYELYLGLGWKDRAEKILPVIARKRRRMIPGV